MLAAFAREQAPIDGIGIGTSLTTSSDAPALDCAYKLQEYAGLPRRKRSVGKATCPGRKQVWRRYGAENRMAGDVISVEDDDQSGARLLQPVMRAGQRVQPSPTLIEIRAHAARELRCLPELLEAVGTRCILSTGSHGCFGAARGRRRPARCTTGGYAALTRIGRAIGGKDW
jgi:nicotinate phosphoribosyltransferase